MSALSCQFNLDQSQLEQVSDKKNRDNTKYPIKISSPSELKPPTLNSSLLSNIHQEQLLAPVKNKSIAHYNFQGLWPNNDFELKQKDFTLYNGNILQRQISQKNNTFNSSRKEKFFSYKEFIINKFVSKITKRIFSIRSKQFSEFMTQLMQEQYIQPLINNIDTDFQNKYQNYQLWNLFVSLIMILSFITLPLQLSFTINQLIYLNIFIIIIFSIDIIVETNKPILQCENIITNKWVIIKHYISKYLILDLLKIILFILVLEIQYDMQVNIILQILYFIISYQKQSIYLNEFCQLINRQFLLQLIILIRFLLLSHIIACIWHQVGMSTQEQPWLNDHINQDNTTRYLLSLQWTIQNLLTIDQSYKFTNKIEILISLIINIISIFNIGYIVKQIYRNTQISSISKKNQQILQNIHHYFNTFEISTQLRVRIQQFLKNYFENSRQSEQQDYNFINLLPNKLQDELIYEQRIKEIKFTKSLKRFSENTLQQLCQIMELKTFKPTDNIIQQSDLQDKSLYIIQSGQIQIYNNNSSKQQNYQILQKHDSFGEWSFYTGQQRMASVKSIGFSKVYKIDQIKFLKIIQTNFKDREIYHFIKHQLLFSNQNQYANLQCYGCHQNDHLIRNCPFLQYQPDLEQIILQNNIHTQNRNVYFRNSLEKKKVTTRTFQNNPIIVESLKYFRYKNQLESNNYDSSNDNTESISQSNYQDLPDCTLDSFIEQGKTVTQNQILKDIEQESDSQILSKYNQQSPLRLIVPSSAEGQSQKNIQKRRKQQISTKKIMSLQNTNLIQDSGYIIESEDQIPEIRTMLQHRQTQTIQNTQKEQDNLLKTLYQIKEQNDSDTLQLSNPEQTSPMVQTKNHSLKSQKIFHLSSALSSIPRIRSVTNKISKQQLQPSETENNPIKSLQQLNHISILDLSYFEKNDQFEIQQNYQIFFPYFNYELVIHRYNLFLIKCINFTQRFNYSLYYKIRQRFLI